MTIVSDACYVVYIIDDASRRVNEASWIIIDDSRVKLQIVASHTYDSRRFIYHCNMFIVLANGAAMFFLQLKIKRK